MTFSFESFNYAFTSSYLSDLHIPQCRLRLLEVCRATKSEVHFVTEVYLSCFISQACPTLRPLPGLAILAIIKEVPLSYRQDESFVPSI